MSLFPPVHTRQADRPGTMPRFRTALLSAFADQQDALRRFLQRRLGNHALAEDLTQETWLRAATANGAEAIGNPKGYLFRIAANLANDHVRQSRRSPELPVYDAVAPVSIDPVPSPEKQAIDRSELRRLLHAVDQLSPRAREVFLLAKVHELSHAEIAARLGIARNTVMVHMTNALAQLHDYLERDPD